MQSPATGPIGSVGLWSPAVGDFFAVCGNVRLHPCDIAYKETHHVKQVCTENNHIFAATAMILLTAGIDGLNGPDLSIVEHLFNRVRCW